MLVIVAGARKDKEGGEGDGAGGERDMATDDAKKFLDESVERRRAAAAR
jgi:hypothetical protein